MNNNILTAPILTSDNLMIRAFTEKDLPIFAQYRSEPAVAQYQSWSQYSMQDAITLFESMDYGSFGSQGNWYQLAISSRDVDELIGDIAVHFIDEDQLEIGFTVSPKHQCQGIATQALTQFLTYAFNVLNKHRVIATTDSQNTASYRLLEKLGFRREAHFKQNIFFKGTWGDEYQYALLQSEYCAK